ncbi:MAG TPA: phosphoglycerate kinase [Candidatus Paceibacterota bacterium]|nr:phosphoglycerate kinase [Candidatus Paceibacterota bacterium]
MRTRSVTELVDLYGMRVFVRTCLDIPIEDGVAQDHFRVQRALPTIQYLIERGARVILATHLGRKPETTTSVLVPLLQKYVPVTHCPSVVGEVAFGAVAHMKEGSVLLLENLRSHEGEIACDEMFAKTLASYADFYVNDAFAVSHRAHASIVGVPKYLPRFAGITFLEEYDALSKSFTPEHPSLFIIGGAKFETKEPLIEDFSNLFSNTFIGGALANDFLRARGLEVGKSLLCGCDISPTLAKHERLILPEEVVVTTDGVWREARAHEVLAHEAIVDVGMQSIERLAPYIKRAKFIVWNGPLGNYEAGYDIATKACGRLVAESDAFSVVGGGDTVASIESLKLQDSFGFLSTAGGAMLDFLEHRTLPGIEALVKA